MSGKRGQWVAIKPKDLKGFDPYSNIDCLWARALKRAFPKAAIIVGAGHRLDSGFSITHFGQREATYSILEKANREYERIWNLPFKKKQQPRCIEFYVPAPSSDGNNYVRRIRLPRKKAA